MALSYSFLFFSTQLQEYDKGFMSRWQTAGKCVAATAARQLASKLLGFCTAHDKPLHNCCTFPVEKLPHGLPCLLWSAWTQLWCTTVFWENWKTLDFCIITLLNLRPFTEADEQSCYISYGANVQALCRRKAGGLHDGVCPRHSRCILAGVTPCIGTNLGFEAKILNAFAQRFRELHGVSLRMMSCTSLVGLMSLFFVSRVSFISFI